METEIREGRVTLRFQGGRDVLAFEESRYDKENPKRLAGGTKAVDVVALRETRRELWLIEVKDYSVHPRTKPSELIDEVATKVRDTLAGLFVMRTRAGGDDQPFAASVTEHSDRIRIALHLEQHTRPSRLKPHVLDPKTAFGKLKHAVTKIDNNPRVVDASSSERVVPWSAEVS